MSGLDRIACLAAVADSSARAEAWRRIAAERRWNHEHIAARGRARPPLLGSEYTFTDGPALLRVSGRLTPDQAAEYAAAFRS